jgi:hypothetical protein
MQRKRPDAVTDPDALDDQTGCPACRDREPNVRYAHYLHSGRVLGLDGTYAHVYAELRAQFPDDPERARGYADDIKYWLGEQMSTFSEVVDAETGAPLPWWEGRKQFIDAMQVRYDEMGRQAKAAEQARVAASERKHRLEIPDPTPLREPGDEDEDLV